MTTHIHLTRRAHFERNEAFRRCLYLQKHPKRRLYESMSDWAEREVELACKKEDGYGAGCYRSALKAFRSLCADGHSGCSIGITKSILNRMIDGKPLTPIEDTPDVWIECCWGDDVGKAVYQNSRMPGLFKDVYPDGTISYHDNDRAVLIEIKDDGSESSWCGKLAHDVVDEIAGSITLPYFPENTPYKVYVKQFDSVNAEPGCIDTTHVIRVVSPDGTAIPIERYYAETMDGMEQIGRVEYLRRERSYKRKLKEATK